MKLPNDQKDSTYVEYFIQQTLSHEIETKNSATEVRPR